MQRDWILRNIKLRIDSDSVVSTTSCGPSDLGTIKPLKLTIHKIQLLEKYWLGSSFICSLAVIPLIVPRFDFKTFKAETAES